MAADGHSPFNQSSSVKSRILRGAFQIRARPDSAARELDTVDARHHEIGDQQIEFVPVEGGKRGVAIGDGDHIMARPLKRSGKKGAHRVVVFSQQDARRGHVPYVMSLTIPATVGVGTLPNHK